MDLYTITFYGVNQLSNMRGDCAMWEQAIELGKSMTCTTVAYTLVGGATVEEWSNEVLASI